MGKKICHHFQITFTQDKSQVLSDSELHSHQTQMGGAYSHHCHKEEMVKIMKKLRITVLVVK
jgi:hypothetical protein